MTDPLLTIGAFARATGLTPTTLRHYDEVGLLPPADVDAATGEVLDHGDDDHGA